VTAVAPSVDPAPKPVRAVRTEPALCCLCGRPPGPVVGTGRDYEYDTTDDVWHMARCEACDVLVLTPRPTADHFDDIYPPHYHAFQFDASQYGFIHTIRRRLEARRLLSLFRNLPADARILDVGCGDGFHLSLLKEFGPKGWHLEGIDASERAVARARAHGLAVTHGTVERAPLAPSGVDAVLTIMTVEHVADPASLVARAAHALKPGGRLVVVTDNARSLDAGWFGKHSWGGYHFPRHTYLFTRSSLTKLANDAGLEVLRVRTLVSPVNWVYSIRNWLVRRNAPSWLVNRFSLSTPLTLVTFTVLDNVLRLFGRGAILQGVFVKPTKGTNDGGT
jgi:SAM-dependent methyltransferase